MYSLYCFFNTQSGGVKVSKGKLQEHGRLAVAKASLNERKELAWHHDEVSELLVLAGTLGDTRC